MSALWGWMSQERLSAGASGAICGVIGGAMVLGYRTQGLRGPLTMAMARWLGLVIVIGFVARFDNAAHIGGAIGGAFIAMLWRRGHVYSAAKQRAILAASALVVVAAGATVAVRDATDPYLFMSRTGRVHAAYEALAAGRCDVATRAISRAKRLDPRAEDVRALEREIGRACAK